MKLISLIEMAIPSKKIKTQTFYHGTKTIDAAKNIFATGLNPKYTEIKYANDSKNILKPQNGKVYLTRDLSYAFAYAFGGDFIGTNVNYNDQDRFGYILEFNGKTLTNIEPDEDSIGEFLHIIWNANNDYYIKRYNKFFIELNKSIELKTLFLQIANSKLTSNQKHKIIKGEYIYFAIAGKKLNTFLTDDIKLWLISLGAHVAHDGIIKPSKIYQIDKAQTSKMKPTNNNLKKFLIPLQI